MKKRILIIEDNVDIRENIAEILQLSGYEVLLAEHGKEGVRVATEHHPDLILCDVMMPELDGFGVLRVLGQNPNTAQIPFIFLTAKSEKTDFRKGMNLGADDYITKPFDDIELLDAIQMRLKKNEQLQKMNGQHEASNTFADAQQGEEALKQLTQDREIRYYRKKDILFREGEYPKQIFFLRKGKVKTCKTNEDGKEFIMSLHGDGEFLGFLPLLQSTTYTESAIALENAEIAIIPQKEFFDLLQKSGVAKYFMQYLATNLVEKEEQLLELAYNSVRKRVADALLRLKRHYDQQNDQHFSISILREDLASLVGTAKETVIRTLSDFKDEALIEIAGSRITILNLRGLEEMIN
jgi:CheY-like chemotaxis protein